MLAIIIAAAVIAAAGVAIGLSSFTRPPQQSEETPTPTAHPTDNGIKPIEEEPGSTAVNSTEKEMAYNAFLQAGWPEQSAAVFSSVKTEYSQSNSTFAQFSQTFPSGIIQDIRLVVTLGQRYVPVEADKIYTPFGSIAYVTDAEFYSSPEFNASKISYFLPYDSLDPELVEQMGWSDPYSQSVGMQIPGLQYASATTETTGVGMAQTVVRSSQPSAGEAGMDARIADAEADLVRFERERAYESVFQEGREIYNQSPDDPIVQEVNRRLTPEAVELRRQQAAFHDAETRQMVDEIRTRYELADNARINSKWLVRITGALGTGLAGYELYQIDNQNDLRQAWLSWYEDCVNNPDIPRFQDPQGRPDPGYEQAREQIASAREGLAVTTAAMYGSSIANGLAGLAAHNPAVEGLTMVASMLEQGMLDGAARDELSGLSQLDTPCRAPPCPDDPQPPESPPPPSGDHTPGPDEPGFFYTIGPRESYEPPERRICKPIGFNQVRVIIHEVVEESQGTPRIVTFDAIANLTNIVTMGNLLYQDPTRFWGNGTGNYHETINYQDDTLAEGWCKVKIEGVATMKVNILRNMSSDQRNLAEAHVTLEGNVPISMNPAGCYRVNGQPPAFTDGTFYSCNFFDVDERGGTYRNGTGPENDRLGAPEWFYDDCDLIMGPLIDAPGVS